MTLSIAQILDVIDSYAPWSQADSWDNVGVLLGARRSPVKSILCALEVTPGVIAEAKNSNADLIIVHHPLIFHPLTRIDDTAYPGNLLAALIRNNISLIAAHTNLDKAPVGTNFTLAGMLRLENMTTLLPEPPRTAAYKFVVFVPEKHEQRIIAAIARGGGGIIGEYSRCTFRSRGHGGFRPSKNASPFIGKHDVYQETPEYRIEALVAPKSLNRVIDEVLKAHPYEQPAYDVYPLEPSTGHEHGHEHGSGCLGSLKHETSLKAFARHVKRILDARAITIVEGSPRTKIRTVAICAGAADSLIRDIPPRPADVLVAGEINHHTALAAKSQGLNIILAGHYETEVVGMERLARLLARHSLIKQRGVTVRAARRQSSPFSS